MENRKSYRLIRHLGTLVFASLFCILNSLSCFHLSGQICTLDEVIRFAMKNSPEALKIKTLRENKYWQWKTYKSQYKPQLVLNATLPYYQKQNIPVRQGDGSIIYKNIHQSQSYVALSLEQNIGITGSTLYLSSDLRRFDDFSQHFSSYSGSPFYVGIEQPLVAFNNLKWMNRIEPLKYEESQKEYVEGYEEIAYKTTIRYFDLLIAQINFQIAAVNKANADTLYRIGLEKYKTGKISHNDLLRIRYGVISAEKSKSMASLSIKNQRLALNSYTGMSENESQTLTLPEDIFRFEIDDMFALKIALENSQQSVEFRRERLEAFRDAEKSRKESRLTASLSVSYGTSNIAEQMRNVYESPQEMLMLNLGLSVPVIDWGRARAERKTAEANLKLAEYSLQQDEISFRQEIITEVDNFRMLRDFIGYTSEAEQIAAERYEIARLRYLVGDISFTEYNIAQDEKDQARRDYITALRDYWLTYYSIRILTLYDFMRNEQLSADF